MTTGICILFTSLIVLLLGSVWVSINSVWTAERKVSDMTDELSAVKRYAMKANAVNDYLLSELHRTTYFDNTTKRFVVVPVCNECYHTHSCYGNCCLGCTGSEQVHLGLTDKDIKSFKMKLDEIDRHVINTKV